MNLLTTTHALNYRQFDWEQFAKLKRFLSLSYKPWLDYATNERLGTKITAVIAEDKTPYITNVEIKPVDVTATVYGDYRNMLPVLAQDIVVVKKTS